MRPIALVFEAADDRPLAATVLEPPRVQGAVVIASATGVPRRIYEGVAGCLADAGLAVLTFDYRGIGGSRQAGPLRYVEQGAGAVALIEDPEHGHLARLRARSAHGVVEAPLAELGLTSR